MPDDLHSELQAHAASIRGLARDLLQDKHAAEDVAQQTLTKAWASREQLQPGPMGGWLQRVVTNFTRQWRRGERRRVARETRHMIERGEENHPSPEETLARREALQSVSDAVLQLDEPYQTAVFLRYFEDLPPRVIAHRTNSNVATVKSRIARGLAMLRQQLSQGESSRDWRAGLALTLGLPIGSVFVPITTGVLLMKASMKVAVVAAAALCIGGFFLYGGDEPIPPTTTGAEAKEAATAEATGARVHSENTEIDRIPASDYKFEEARLSHPYVLELTVRVVDEHGLPIAGFTPELAPPGRALRNADVSTDDTGTAIVRWPARQPRVAIEILDPRRHRRLVMLQSGTPNHVTLIGKNNSGPSLRLLGTRNEVALISFDASTPVLAGNATSNKLSPGLHANAVFSERGLVPIVPPPETVEQQLSDVFLGEASVNWSGLGEFTVQYGNIQADAVFDGQPSEAPTYCSVEGFVYGEDGKPKGDVPVVILGTSQQPLHRGKTDKSGAFHFEKLLANTYEVRAGGTHLGLTKVSLRVDKGHYTQHLNLQRDACIRGRLLDETSKAVGKATIEWLSADGKWADRTNTNDDGSFLLANLPSGPGTLYAWHHDKSVRFPIAHMPGVRPDSGEVTVQCEPTNTGTLRLQPNAAAECKLNGLRLRVRNVATGFSRGISTPLVVHKTTGKDGKERNALISMPDGPWQQTSLPAGFYEVEMWLAGCGTKNLGRHWVDGEADTDLGSVALAAPGLVQFSTPSTKVPDDLKVEICALRQPFDVRVESLHTLQNDVRLAAGNYVLATQRGTQPTRFQTFEVHSDQTTTVEVAW